MDKQWPTNTVRGLQDEGTLLVEDGNHGESRPRRNEFVDHGVAFIRASDMSVDSIDFLHADRINEVALSRITKGVGEPGDILFSHKGTVGKLALAPDNSPPFVCSPQTTFWRVCDEDRLDRRFLLAFMRSRLFKDQWMSRKGETDMADYVSLTAQRKFAIPLPDIREQHAIGDLLEPLNEKIITSRQFGDLLHSTAERLFRKWFIDLELNDEDTIDDLLPIEVHLKRAVVNVRRNGEGDLPDGWTRQPLDRIANYRNGIAMQRFPPTNDGWFPVLKIAQLRDESLTGADRVTKAVPSEIVVRDGDVIFSWSGSLMVKLWSGGTAALNQHLFRVTSDLFPKWFYYFWTRAHLQEFRAIADDKRTTMGHIKREHLRSALANTPDNQFLEVADSFFRPLLDRIVHSDLQARRLEAMRDRILRALMSGEIRLLQDGAIGAAL